MKQLYEVVTILNMKPVIASVSLLRRILPRQVNEGLLDSAAIVTWDAEAMFFLQHCKIVNNSCLGIAGNALLRKYIRRGVLAQVGRCVDYGYFHGLLQELLRVGDLHGSISSIKEHRRIRIHRMYTHSTALAESTFITPFPAYANQEIEVSPITSAADLVGHGRSLGTCLKDPMAALLYVQIALCEFRAFYAVRFRSVAGICMVGFGGQPNRWGLAEITERNADQQPKMDLTDAFCKWLDELQRPFPGMPIEEEPY